MLHQIHRVKLVCALSLTLAAVAAAPAATRFDNTSGLVPTTSQPSSHPSTNLCSEVCLGAITSRGSTVTSPYSSKPVASPSTSSHGSGLTVVRVTKHGGGFAWGDAAIGAGVAIGLLALLAGGAGASATRRSRRLGESSATATS